MGEVVLSWVREVGGNEAVRDGNFDYIFHHIRDKMPVGNGKTCR